MLTRSWLSSARHRIGSLLKALRGCVNSRGPLRSGLLTATFGWQASTTILDRLPLSRWYRSQTQNSGLHRNLTPCSFTVSLCDEALADLAWEASSWNLRATRPPERRCRGFVWTATRTMNAFRPTICARDFTTCEQLICHTAFRELSSRRKQVVVRRSTPRMEPLSGGRWTCHQRLATQQRTSERAVGRRGHGHPWPRRRRLAREGARRLCTAP